MSEAQGKSHSEGCGIFSWKSLYFFEPYVSQADLCRLGRDYIGAGKYTDMVFPSLGCRFIALKCRCIHSSISIICDDGTGIVFSNSFTGLGTYGELDDEGCVTTPLGYISASESGYEYEPAN